MTRESLTGDVAKFAATGLLAFFSSCLYTNYETRPSSNINVFPLKVTFQSGCAVAQDKLQKARAAHTIESPSDADEYTLTLISAPPLATQSPPATAPKSNDTDPQDPIPGVAEAGAKSRGEAAAKSESQGWTGHLRKSQKTALPDDYALYLASVTSKYVFQNSVPNLVWAQLQDDHVIECTEAPSAKSASVCDSTRVALEGTVLIDKPAAYMLDRECELVVKGEHRIPVRATIDGRVAAIKSSGAVEDEKRPLAISKTSPVSFRYDPAMSPSKELLRQQLAEGLEALKKAIAADLDYDLAISCQALTSAGAEVNVGGRQVKFRNDSIRPARPGWLRQVWMRVTLS